MRKLPVGFEVKELAKRIDRSMDAFVAKHSGGALTGMNGRRRESDVFQKDVEAAFRIRRSTATAFLQHMEAARMKRQRMRRSFRLTTAPICTSTDTRRNRIPGCRF